jgi:hypothetical protein
MQAGHGGTPRGPLRGRAPHRGGASRQPRGSRRPEDANAWGKAQDRLTAGRYRARESSESEAMRQNAGLLPEGGLARQPMEERPPAWLSPPKTEVPRHATRRGQNGTHAAEGARAVMVRTTLGGASRSPGQPGETPRGHRWGQVPHTAPAMVAGHDAPTRWHGHRAPTPRETQARIHDGQTPCGPFDPNGQRSANRGPPSPGTRRGRHALAAHLWLPSRTVLPRGHRSALHREAISTAIRAHTRHRHMRRDDRPSGLIGQSAGASPDAPTTQSLAPSGPPGRGRPLSPHGRNAPRRQLCTALSADRAAGDGGSHPPGLPARSGHRLRR